jgi:DNA-binding Lrp family transcriptional regulator
MVYQPDLGRALGNLYDAIVLQQLQYWGRRATKEFDGARWVYKSYAQLGAEVGLSADQIRRSVARLRKLGVVVSIRNPYVGMDQVRWYRIDYVALNALVDVQSVDGPSPAPLVPNQVVAWSRTHRSTSDLARSTTRVNYVREEERTFRASAPVPKVGSGGRIVPVALRLRDLGWARWEIGRRRVLCDEMTRHGLGWHCPQCGSAMQELAPDVDPRELVRALLRRRWERASRRWR